MFLYSNVKNGAASTNDALQYVRNLNHIILVQANSHNVVKGFIGTWVWKLSNYHKLGPVTTLSAIFVKM